MNIQQAQADIQHAYFGGAAGVLVSASAWLFAGIVALLYTELASIIGLFIAAQFIFPLSIVLSKILGSPGTTSKGNTLALLGLESTGILVFCYPIAYAAFLAHSEWFYPAMLVFIGVRYLVFNTLYGNKIYWLMGFSLIIAGYLVGFLRLAFYWGAFIGAGIEIVFGLAIALLYYRRSSLNSKISR